MSVEDVLVRARCHDGDLNYAWFIPVVVRDKLDLTAIKCAVRTQWGIPQPIHTPSPPNPLNAPPFTSHNLHRHPCREEQNNLSYANTCIPAHMRQGSLSAALGSHIIPPNTGYHRLHSSQPNTTHLQSVVSRYTSSHVCPPRLGHNPTPPLVMLLPVASLNSAVHRTKTP